MDSPHTGDRTRVSYVLQQEKIRIVLTSALSPNNEIAKHVNQHGDGVKTLALSKRNTSNVALKLVNKNIRVFVK